MIKVDFWSDQKIGRVSNDAKLLFIGIWNLSDDGGVSRCDPVYLKSNLFPYSEFPASKITNWLGELEEKNLIKMVKQREELYCIVPNFLKHQQIKKPSSFRYLDDSSPLVPYSELLVATKEKEKEKEKVKEKGNTGNKLPDQIVDLWNSKANEFDRSKVMTINAKRKKLLLREIENFKTLDDWRKIFNVAVNTEYSFPDGKIWKCQFDDIFEKNRAVQYYEKYFEMFEGQ
jgi:hypothetical protein